MKQKDILYLVATAFFVGLVSFVIASLVFKTPSKRTATVPIVQTIDSSFPDVKNDPTYKAFLNTQALDPTQPIQIGSGQNAQPFSGAR